MDESIKVTEQQIDDVLKYGLEFVTKHPVSYFHTDNTEGYETVKRILNLAKGGNSVENIKEIEDLENLDDGEYFSIANVVDWLSGDSDEAPYCIDDAKS